ncbi:hypothetical protein BC830DRAFT_1128840 [Chytriomyces sp. MP71]|nr:hypothetical protein BC830DRAFT_1128840 [Chytriomyces sp. MP71]
MAPSVAQQPQVPQSYSEETKIEGVSGFFHQPGVKIAEGILGAAAAAGLGAFALHEWRKHDKVKNTHAPAFQQYPTQHGTLEWMRVGGPLPSNAIQLGRDTDGTPLYAGRAAFEGGWHVGKIHLNELKIGYGGKEHTIQNGFEVLCGSPHGITVLPQTGAVNLAGLMKQPIDAGHEANGDRLFLAIFDDNGSVQVGKAGTHLMNGGSYCYAGKELSALQYRVVVLA